MNPDAIDAETRAQMVACMRRVCPTWLADQRDDLVQMACVKLMRSKSEAELNPAYLSRVAYTVVIDEVRRRQRRQEVGMSPSLPDRIANSAELSPETRARGTQVGRVLVECLQELGDDRRQAVALYLQDHGVPEIARILDCDRKRASNLVYRGMSDLRAELRARGVEP